MEAKNTKGIDVENVNLKKEKSKLTLTFDLSKKVSSNNGLSSTGNSVLISSSKGEIEVSENTYVTFNVYRKLPKEERQKAKKAVKAASKKEPEIDAKLVAAIAKALKGM